MKPKTLALLLLAIAVSFISLRPAAGITNSIAVDLKIPDGYGRLDLSEQDTALTLSVTLDQRPQTRGPDLRPRLDVERLGLQAWLLKKDGTTVAQRHEKPVGVTIGMGHTETTSVQFAFNKIPLSEIVGVVLLKKGKLYCQTIPASEK